MNPSAEQVLHGGNVAEVVVRVGSTVRKPAGVALISELHDAAESFQPPLVPQWNVVIAPDREDLV